MLSSEEVALVQRLVRVALTVTALMLALPAASGEASPTAPLGSAVNATASISLVKYPRSQTVVAGGTATFTITVRNNGGGALTSVKVSDSRMPSCNRGFATMAAGASFSYTCRRSNVTRGFESVAISTGRAPAGRKVIASDRAPVEVTPLSRLRTTAGMTKPKRPELRPIRPLLPHILPLTG